LAEYSMLKCGMAGLLHLEAFLGGFRSSE